jgi:hypothetical protein
LGLLTWGDDGSDGIEASLRKAESSLERRPKAIID